MHVLDAGARRRGLSRACARPARLRRHHWLGGRYDGDLASSRLGIREAHVAGAADWGVYQKPGDFERMQANASTDLRGCHLVTDAGHWVQQEQPQAVSRLLIDFLQPQVLQ
jgi:pimeloyl-ACP methyl ester carboxylesterase